MWKRSPDVEESSEAEAARIARAQADGLELKTNFEQHAQHVFSHVQHHWHSKEDGVRVPAPHCRKQGPKRKKGLLEEICKHEFPRTRRLNLTPKVICLGVARMQKVVVKGRRSSLCLLPGNRRCAGFQ